MGRPLRPINAGIKNWNGRYEDGLITCEFRRPALLNIPLPHRNENKTFQLENDQYSVFLAEGPFQSGLLGYHNIKDYTILQKLGEVHNLVASSKIALRLHGAFMIFAWIGSASLGMLVARYFKQTWTSTQCCKKDIWFVLHRTLMVLTWLLTMAGFLLIFYQSGWVWIYRSDESFDKNGNPHPILGVVTTVLCFVQPFMALVRPHPGSSSRPLFNWMHWFVGNGAHITGIVTIFFAVQLDKSELPKETDSLLIAFVIFHALVHLIMSCVMCKSEHDAIGSKSTKNGYPMRQMGRSYPDYEELKRDAPGAGLRKFFLAVYILVGSLITAALIAMAVLAPTRDFLVEFNILPETESY